MNPRTLAGRLSRLLSGSSASAKVRTPSGVVEVHGWCMGLQVSEAEAGLVVGIRLRLAEQRGAPTGTHVYWSDDPYLRAGAAAARLERMARAVRTGDVLLLREAEVRTCPTCAAEGGGQFCPYCGERLRIGVRTRCHDGVHRGERRRAVDFYCSECGDELPD
jgi:hypothetical protein